MEKTSRLVILATVAVFAASASTAVVAQVEAPETQNTRVLGLRGSAVLISMDGPLVAIHSSRDDEVKDETCHHVSFWNAVSGTIVRVQATKAESCDLTADLVAYMAMAGRRVVWTSHTGGGRYPVCAVYTATVDAPRAREIPECEEDEETGYGSGEDVGAWAGDGPLLVGNSEWGEPACGGEGGCPAPALVRVRPTRLQEVKTGDAFLYVRSVDAGRIALLREEGDAAILNAAGRELRVIQARPEEIEHVVIQGNDLAVKKARSVEVYDVRTGKLRRTWNLKPGSYMLDMHAGVAALVRGRRVQLLRLADGHGAAYTAAGRIVSAELEGPGLAYAFNVPRGGSKPGRVAFVPFEALRRALR